MADLEARTVAGTRQMCYTLPHLGVVSFQLYPPADEVYDLLDSNNEIKRLKKLQHTGVLSLALPGVYRSRWDYTVSMLYFAHRLSGEGLNSGFMLGGVRFTSMKSALQTLALLWNIGHLPGTFAVEKGVARYLYDLSPDRPATTLLWPQPAGVDVTILQDAANDALRVRDYLLISRLLGLLKLLEYSHRGDVRARRYIEFISEFIFHGLRRSQDLYRWRRVEYLFSLLRHISYLNLDASLSGMSWAPDVPTMFHSHMENSTTVSREATLLDELPEILSPIERAVYRNLYHRPESRLIVAVVADHVHTFLSNVANPERVISVWMRRSSINTVLRGLQLADIQAGYSRIGMIKLRSHFIVAGRPLAGLEAGLKHTSEHRPVVLRWESWNSERLIEPDEIIIENYVKGTARPSHVGKLLTALTNMFDDWDLDPRDTVGLLRTLDLQSAYLTLLSKALSLLCTSALVKFVPWPLQVFGLFPELSFGEEVGAVWLGGRDLSNRIVRYLLRDRRRQIPQGLRDRYAELWGLRTLRDHIRPHQQNQSRVRWFVLTCSIRVQKNGRDLIEFDGGLVRVTTKSGRMVFYGLETKSGRENPVTVLRRKLHHIGIPNALVSRAGRDSAFVTIDLSTLSSNER